MGLALAVSTFEDFAMALSSATCSSEGEVEPITVSVEAILVLQPSKAMNANVPQLRHQVPV
jgi:hypothetical protein